MPTAVLEGETVGEFIRLGKHYEVRLPTTLMRRLKLRTGAQLLVIPTNGGVHLVAPKRLPKSQRYFYTPEWQAKEQEADKDITAGRVKRFTDVEGLLHDLRGI